MSTASVQGNHGVKVVRSYTVRRPASELYDFWRNLENLTLIIKHPVAIARRSALESHWSVSAPLGHDPVEWDAIIINEEPGKLLAWQSKPGADVPNAGSVRFEAAPDPAETEVTVKLEYDPPGGKVGMFFAKLSSDEPGRQVADALRRFKALMEAGEIPRIRGQSVGQPQADKNEKKENA